MGYNTEFYGSFCFDKPLTKEQILFIYNYSRTRHFIRPDVTPSKVMLDAGINDVGSGACYYALDDVDNKYHNEWTKYKNHYNDPGLCPGLWCQWIVSDSGLRLEWDGMEKFYNYLEWLNFLIENFFSKWNYNLTGFIKYQGEDDDDFGFIRIKNNKAYYETENLIFL